MELEAGRKALSFAHDICRELQMDVIEGPLEALNAILQSVSDRACFATDHFGKRSVCVISTHGLYRLHLMGGANVGCLQEWTTPHAYCAASDGSAFVITGNNDSLLEYHLGGEEPTLHPIAGKASLVVGLLWPDSGEIVVRYQGRQPEVVGQELEPDLLAPICQPLYAEGFDPTAGLASPPTIEGLLHHLFNLPGQDFLTMQVGNRTGLFVQQPQSWWGGIWRNPAWTMFSCEEETGLFRITSGEHATGAIKGDFNFHDLGRFTVGDHEYVWAASTDRTQCGLVKVDNAFTLATWTHQRSL